MVYSTGIIENMDMRSKAINSFLGRRSESTVVEKGNLEYKVLNHSCEETQLQRIEKDAKALLDPYKIRLFKGSRKVRETFTVENLTKIMMAYNSVINQAEQVTSIYHIIADPCFLLLAYATLRKDAAAGLDDVPTTHVTFAGILLLSKKLKMEKYKCTPARRIYIPKKGGKRPLGLTSTIDKIVQKALHMVMSPIFDKSFSEFSHGFRPNRSCHTALNSILKNGNRTIWFIELDLVKAFERIHHEILIKEIQVKIKEQQLIDLIYKLLRVGYVNIQNLIDSKLEQNKGTPQGSILSPLLANIFFHKLDMWFEKILLPKYNVPRIYKINSEYQDKVTNHINNKWGDVVKITKKLAPDISSKKVREHIKVLRKQQAGRENIKYSAIDPNHRKLWYVRYADDMLLGFIGPKYDANSIFEDIKTAVDKIIKMEIHPEKSGIEHHSDGVLFLGYRLLGRYDDNVKWDGVQRRVSNHVKFSIPTKKLIKKYAEKGFLQIAKKGKNTKHVARRVDKWIYLVGDNVVINRFNAVLRGLAYYYSGSEYPSALYELYELLRRSCALTLAHRHKMRTAKSAFTKWGRNLHIKYEQTNKHKEIIKKSVEFTIPKIETGKWNIKNSFQGNLNKLLADCTPQGNFLPKTLSGIVSATELDCCIPKCCNKAAEWHHVTNRKRAKRRSSVEAIVAAYKTKQIPICSAHHKLITAGKYDGSSLRKLPGYTKDNF
jgi:group II intron reverse transcriptase/maturase